MGNPKKLPMAGMVEISLLNDFGGHPLLDIEIISPPPPPHSLQHFRMSNEITNEPQTPAANGRPRN